jgi:hypothetical protein
MKDEGFCYVAGDPTQPGSAWAATVDLPEYAKDTAKCVAQWIKKGAVIERVPTQTAIDMLKKWKRPAKASSKQTSLLPD